MAIALPRSLSARITIGFMVLVVTFGSISVWTVMTIDELNRAIRLTYGGYLQLALKTGDLNSHQISLQTLLREEWIGDDAKRLSVLQLESKLNRRQDLVNETVEILREVAAIENLKPDQFKKSNEVLGKLQELIDRSKPKYDVLIPGASADLKSEEETEALIRLQIPTLRRNELEMGALISRFKDEASKNVLTVSRRMEAFTQLIWILAVVFGALAVILGIAMTVGARVMLRPLQRLRDAAGSIAAGDYAQRIDVQGPREIADLAREFNVMGQAIQERSRELIRTERLATAGKMAAMITHEVRNPLSSISLNTELLEEELAALPEDRAQEAQSLCRAITTEVDRLTDITEEYLQLARMPTPKLQDESLCRVVRSVVDFVRDQLLTRGVRVALELDESGPNLSLDEGQIRQVVLNLIRNAADAAAEVADGLITVSVKPGRNETWLVIEDNGTGITDELIEQIFEAFVSSKESGTGLGLALTQQIIGDHGGTIEVQNAPSSGAIFSICFPHV